MNRFQLSRQHLFRQHLSWQHLSISGKSQLLLTRFWPNFKCRFLEPFSTDAKCHGDICPSNIYSGNICNDDICPYRNISAVSDPILTKLFRSKFFGTLFFHQNIFWPKISFDPNFFGQKIFFWHKFFLTQLMDSKFC